MIDLKKITKGREQKSPRVLVYSFEGTGKTKMASGAPNPFFIDLDKGSHFYDVHRLIPDSWSETMEIVDAVEAGKVKCDSLVIDSVTQLEMLGHREFFPQTTIDAFDGGYGRGETHANMKWRELLNRLERVWNQGKVIVLVAHATVKKFDDPTGPAYERFEVGVRPKLAGILRQWVDYVFFCREEISITAPPKGERARKATTSGTRWAYTRRTPAYDAKSRGTLLFPEKFLLSWDEFERCVESERSRAKEMGLEIDAMLAEIGDADLTALVHKYMKDNPDAILESHQRVTARVEAYRLSKQAVESAGPPTATNAVS